MATTTTTEVGSTVAEARAAAIAVAGVAGVAWLIRTRIVGIDILVREVATTSTCAATEPTTIAAAAETTTKTTKTAQATTTSTEAREAGEAVLTDFKYATVPVEAVVHICGGLEEVDGTKSGH